jgi:acyl-CoA thioesterase-1
MKKANIVGSGEWGVGSRKLQLLTMVLLSGNLIALAGCAKREIANINSHGKNIICFGDSITMGYGVSAEYSYPTFLAKMVSIPVINAGIDGDTSTEGLRRIKSDVLDNKPLLVIIEFGANDFLKKVPFTETLKNTEEMIQKSQEVGAIVALADVSNPVIMNEYGKAFKKLSLKYQAIFIPRITRGIFTNPTLKSDFIHPNEKGYQIIARRIYEAIRPHLKRNKEINTQAID